MPAHSAMNWIDITILAVLGISVLISFIRGFIREALSLFIWAGAAYVSLKFGKGFSQVFVGHINTPAVRLAVGFVSLFVIVLIAGAILSYVLSLLVEKTGLSGSDRLLGMIFGLARGVLVVSVLILVAKLTNLPKDPVWKESMMLPKFTPVEMWLHNFMDKQVKTLLPMEKMKRTGGLLSNGLNPLQNPSQETPGSEQGVNP